MTASRFKAAPALLLALALDAAPAAPAVPGFDRDTAGDASSGLLATELNCTACHAGAPPALKPKGAPDLSGAGARLHGDWLIAFLADPDAAHPGTTMPHPLAALPEAERGDAAEAIAHHLATRRDWKPPKLFKYASPETGRTLFARIGCAACHNDPVDEPGAAEPGLVPLGHVAAKFPFPALTDFLMRPLDHRRGGRMPDMKLTPGEAADIAAHLLGSHELAENDHRAPHRPLKPDPAKARAGAELYSELNCAACHEPGAPAPPAPGYAEIAGRGPCTSLPYPSLSAAQRQTLSAPQPEGAPPVPLAHTLSALNCYACHGRGGVGGPLATREPFFTGDPTLGDEGRFPPHLDGVGRKLKSAALAAALAGEGGVRPYLETRMPVFGDAGTAHLAAAFAAADLPGEEPAAPGGADVDAGRVLLGTEGGVGCISCHGVGGRRGLAMRALSLDGAPGRYRYGWFRDNLLDPASTRPGTLMPAFWPGGEASNTAVLGGDAEAQIAAIWAYLDTAAEGRPLPPGFPDHDSTAFEITPTDRPVVQRTMVEGVGAQAIAVGFPTGVHFVYDAETCRVALAWRGRFIDGYKTWFSRLDPTAEPLGEPVADLRGDGPSPAHGARRFGGYRLDPSGVPTFLYHEDGVLIEERIAPDGEGDLTRTLTRGELTETEPIRW